MLAKLGMVLVTIVFTLLSGYFDSRGFLYASKIWVKGELVFVKLIKSSIYFNLGMVFYWIVLRYLKDLNIAMSTEIQTLAWFAVTMIGVALTSGELVKWVLVDRIVVLVVLLGVGWLLLKGH